ncbi:MAG TPA: HAD-IB family phosphatase [Candidatus Saccharimonadia bacterium]|jgi:D-3-phosphoglycerate dehydrogenase
MSTKAYLVLDFDSTLVRVESLDELARIALAGVKGREGRMARIEELTRLGMEGKLGFGESLEQRLQLFAAGQEHLNELNERLLQEVTPSVARARDWVRGHAGQIYVISGGFRECIVPLVRGFGIEPGHVLANTFVRDETGRVIGCDKTNPLARDGGKVEAVRALNLPGCVVIVGDGYSDWQVREREVANEFWAFTENVERPEVSLRADRMVKSFDEIINSGILAELNSARV